MNDKGLLLFFLSSFSLVTKEARVRFRVRFRVWIPVQYSDTIIFRKVGYGYGRDICFIKFFYILLCIYFSYINKHM